MNVIQEIQRINKAELVQNLTNTPASWHAKYANSAWVYIGGLPTQLTEGDILAISSQWGEIEDINLVREEDTGKSRGFCFVKYDDSRSCVLAVDNFNGSQILGKSLRVDHVENYRLPKHLREKESDDEDVAAGRSNARIDADGDLKAGHAYHGKELKNKFNIHEGIDLFAPVQRDETRYAEGGADIDKDQQRRAKLLRKAERDRIRREREVRRQAKEESRRRKRADAFEHENENADIDSSHLKSDGHERKTKKKRDHDNRKKNRQENATLKRHRDRRKGDRSGSRVRDSRSDEVEDGTFKKDSS